MSSGRFPLGFMLVALLACGPALAQETPGGEASTWTDPPARTAPQEPSKSETPAAPEPKGPEPARAERVQVPARIDPPRAQPTRAEIRQEQIRRAVALSTQQRAAEAAARAARTPRRSVVERPVQTRRVVERPRPVVERAAPRPRERLAYQPRSLRRPVYGYADPEPVGPAYGRYEAGPPMREPRMWAEGPDYGAHRIAQARSAGYIVMRSRSYGYPDGTVVRRLSPLGADEIED